MKKSIIIFIIFILSGITIFSLSSATSPRNNNNNNYTNITQGGTYSCSVIDSSKYITLNDISDELNAEEGQPVKKDIFLDGVKVTLRDTTGNNVVTLNTDKSRELSQSVNPGIYDVLFEKQGYKSVERKNIEINTDEISFNRIFMEKDTTNQSDESNILYEFENDQELITITGLKNDLSSIVIPKVINGYPVVSIDSFAFSRCSSLTNIELSDGITSIGNGAFSNCTNLKSFKLPEGLTFLGDNAFLGCNSLTNIKIPNGIESIRYGTFANCQNLKDVQIPDSVTNIGQAAFSHCTNLKNIQLPQSLTGIQPEAFEGCNSLTNITIPGSVKVIGTVAFASCTNLEKIEILDGLESIKFKAFYNCSNLKSIFIPNSVTSIDSKAFDLCGSDFVIHASNGSYAEEYANSTNINFKEN
ncbi:MAG: leucine-rich repeat protein [Intestinibacter bartlettii]|uniref:leucine-rich repeat protein n=1 Tax=Intestinibacter bartlettii TaxID=261299 RepID=UPI0026EDFFED|nr:leucine-rich repeat protein [Intestinibacter bartlettii]MDO5011036.1 leucine-rich repeat protein [Intestinibacter bartlettii]